MNAFIGISYLRGISSDNHLSRKELWNMEDPLNSLVYNTIFSKNRFLIIKKFLRFDDNSTRNERRKISKLAPIKEFCEIINRNFIKAKVPETNVCIDEQLVAFRGRCPFRIYMKSKPDKFGIKLWLLVDEKGYVVQYDVYLGKINEKREVDQGIKILIYIFDYKI